jgi:hypothetical protein
MFSTDISHLTLVKTVLLDENLEGRILEIGGMAPSCAPCTYKFVVLLALVSANVQKYGCYSRLRYMQYIQASGQQTVRPHATPKSLAVETTFLIT